MLIWRYVLGGLISLPLVPFLYFQAIRVRKRVPELPEAENPEGKVEGTSDKVLRLLVIGESTMAGVGVKNHEKGFAASLSSTLAGHIDSSIHWKVLARSGYNVKQITHELLAQIPSNSADIVVVGVGANDAFELNNPIRWSLHVRTLIETLKNRLGQVPVVFVNMPPIRDFPALTPLLQRTVGGLVELLGSQLTKTIRDYQHVYYDSRIISLDYWKFDVDATMAFSDFFSDGIHPSELTYRVWGEKMAEFIHQHVLDATSQSIVKS